MLLQGPYRSGQGTVAQLAQGAGQDPVRSAGAHRGSPASGGTGAGASRPCGYPCRCAGHAGRLAADRHGTRQPDRGAAPAADGCTPGPCTAAAHGGGPASAGERPVRTERPAGAAAAHFAQPAGKILYLPVWLFPAVCAGSAAPQAGRAFSRPERHPDALGAADGAGPAPGCG